MARRSLQGLTDPVDGASLAFFRIAFGLVVLWEVLRQLLHGWVARDYGDPQFHFAYFNLEWLRPWPDPFTHLHFVLLGGLAIGIVLGFHYRFCAALFFVGYTTLFLWEKATYQNHNYLICLVALLMSVVPAHRVAALDARREPRPDPFVPRWALWLLRFQIAIPYVFGGIAKLGGDWLQGQPMRMWLAERTDFPLFGRFFEEPWMVDLFVWGGLLFDLAIVPLMLLPRTRGLAFAVAVAFHLINDRLFAIGVFPWFMIAGTTLFFEPDWPRRILSRRRGSATPAVTPPSWGRMKALPMSLLVAWVAVQVLVPFRHLFYPGRSDWTEEGRRFSWHMKLRDKRARIHSITVRDAESGETGGVDPRDYLTNRQITQMCMHPEMIRQFARHVADRAESAGIRAELRADIRVSLNGRPYRKLIDPEIDLAAVHPGWGSEEWILSLSAPLPTR